MLEKNCLDSDRSSSFVTNDIYKHLSCVFCSLINGFSAEMYTPIINLLMQTKTHKSNWNESICLVIKLNNPLICHLPDFLALSLWNFVRFNQWQRKYPFGNTKRHIRVFLHLIQNWQLCQIWYLQGFYSSKRKLDRGSLSWPLFMQCTLHFLDLEDSPRINRTWLYKNLNVSDLQAHARLAQLDKH